LRCGRENALDRTIQAGVAAPQPCLCVITITIITIIIATGARDNVA
jgi:hypothetical protein